MMTDRETDLCRLKLMGGNREITPAHVVIMAVLTLIVFVLAAISSALGSSYLILAALGMSLSCVFTIVQYSVSGPLHREIQRLREELNELRKNDLNG